MVFVYLQDAKPKRKVAVPVPDWYTWNDFLQQVKAKLKIAGVRDIYMPSTGQKVVSLDEVQDIDELCVVDGPEVVTVTNGNMLEAVNRSGSTATTSEIIPQDHLYRQTSSGKHKVVVADGAARVNGIDADDQKYSKRSSGAPRFLQRLFPNFFAPALPVTTKDVKLDDKGQDLRGVRRRRKRPMFTLRTVLMLVTIVSCLGAMLYLFTRVDIQT